MWRNSNESRCFDPLLAHKHYIEHLSNSSYRFIEENYIAIIIVIELSPSPKWTEAGVSASRVTTLRRLQEKGYQATSEPETTSEASYLGCGEKELDSCSVVQSRAVTITALPHHRGNEMPTAELRSSPSSPHFFCKVFAGGS